MKWRIIGSIVVVAAVVGYQIFVQTPENEDPKDLDSVVMVDNEDKEMEKAIADARRTVPDFLERLNQPQPNDDSFSVKKEVVDNGQSEHFWLTDITYKDGVFEGKIGNEPELVKNVKFGEMVQVNEKDISDWMWLTDGKMYGGYTLRAMLKYMPKAQADELRAQFQLE